MLAKIIRQMRKQFFLSSLSTCTSVVESVFFFVKRANIVIKKRYVLCYKVFWYAKSVSLCNSYSMFVSSH